jgi:tripartite-type tricarboxylate transporter receptor subunit TctC
LGKKEENMKRINVFRYLSILACVFSLLGAGLEATVNAQEKFPTRPIELIVPTTPGGGTDTLARLVGDAAASLLEQKVVVINKIGGSGTIGTNAIVHAKADGYTLGCVWNSPLTTTSHVLKVTYTLNDFSYITQLAKTATIFCVRSEFPAKEPKEFFEYARRNPGKLTYANDGIGNQVQFSAEKIFRAMNVKLRPVPFSGAGESMKALLGGHVDVYGGAVITALPHIEAGTVSPVFVATKERLEALPDVVGASDLGHPEAASSLWWGIVGPKGIPANRLEFLEKAFRQAMQTQKIRDHLKPTGEKVMASSGKEFEEQVLAEAAANAIIAKELGLSPK